MSKQINPNVSNVKLQTKVEMPEGNQSNITKVEIPKNIESNKSSKKQARYKVLAVLITFFVASVLIGLGVLGLTFIPGRNSIVELIKTKEGIILFRILVSPLAGIGSFGAINMAAAYAVFWK